MDSTPTEKYRAPPSVAYIAHREDPIISRTTAPSEVLPEIWRFPIPLAGHGIGHINAYILRDDDRLLMIDTGYAVPEAQEAVTSMLQSIGHRITDVHYVIATHLHADHCGSAGWIQRASGASVAMHAEDAELLRVRYGDQAQTRAATQRWAEEVGAPKHAAAAAIAQVARWREQFVDVIPDQLIVDGETIEHGRFRLQALHTPGHTPGHLCLYEATTGAMFTGDTVLPRITYSPTYRPFPSEDPLGQYLESLARLAGFHSTCGLPGHQEPFADVPGRIAELRTHHRDRSERIVELLSSGERTAWQVARDLPRTRRWNEVRAAGQLSAVGEVYAHLRALCLAGRATASESLPHRWSIVCSPSAAAGGPPNRTSNVDDRKES